MQVGAGIVRTNLRTTGSLDGNPSSVGRLHRHQFNLLPIIVRRSIIGCINDTPFLAANPPQTPAGLPDDQRSLLYPVCRTTNVKLNGKCLILPVQFGRSLGWPHQTNHSCNSKQCNRNQIVATEVCHIHSVHTGRIAINTNQARAAHHNYKGHNRSHHRKSQKSCSHFATYWHAHKRVSRLTVIIRPVCVRGCFRDGLG